MQRTLLLKNTLISLLLFAKRCRPLLCYFSFQAETGIDTASLGISINVLKQNTTNNGYHNQLPKLKPVGIFIRYYRSDLYLITNLNEIFQHSHMDEVRKHIIEENINIKIKKGIGITKGYFLVTEVKQPQKLIRN